MNVDFVKIEGPAEYVHARFDDRKTIRNQGPNTCYYGGGSVSASSNDGSLTSGSSLTLADGKFFVSAGRSRLVVSDVDEERDREFLSARDFGAFGNGVADDSGALQAAIRAAVAQERALYLPPGTYIADDLDVAGNLVIRGDNATIRVSGPEKRGIRSSGSDADNFYDYFDIEGVTFVGSWQEEQSLGDDLTDRLLQVRYFDRIRVANCTFTDGRHMSIGGIGNDVLIEGNTILRSARDSINFSSSVRCHVVNNTIRWGGDDSIAIHQAPSTDTRFPDGVVIEGNIIEDCFGIKCLAGARAVISNNVLKRPKAYGVNVYTDTSYGEGVVDKTAVVISDNVVTDVINGTVFGSGDQHDWIKVGSSTGEGTFKNWKQRAIDEVDFESYWYASRISANTHAGGHGIQVTGNVCQKTLPDVAQYDDWGYGEAFTNAGWTNPAVSMNRKGHGCALSNVEQVLVANNQFLNVEDGLYYHGGKLPRDIVFAHNIVRRAKYGIQVGTLAAGSRLGLRSAGNLYDLDPVYEASNHSANGGWADTNQDPCAFASEFAVEGIVSVADEFRNQCKLTHTVVNTRFVRPIFVGAPTGTSASNSGNAGIRLLLSVLEAVFIPEDVDPASPDFGNMITVPTPIASGGTAEPTTGVWLPGMQQLNSAPSAAGKVGWVCVTGGWASGTAWGSGQAVVVGDLRYNGAHVYQSWTAGTTGSTAPVHASGTASDDVVTWKRLGAKAAFKEFGVIDS